MINSIRLCARKLLIGGPGSLMAAGGVVHLRAYTRSRDGRTEHVRAHMRSDPPGGGPIVGVPGEQGYRERIDGGERVIGTF